MSYLQHQIAQLIQCSKAQEGQEPYYEVLEYIQFDGTQYYNLGFKSQLGTGYEMGVQFDDLGSAGCGVCGSRDNSSASENNIGTFVGSSTSVVSDYNNSSYTGSRYTVPKTDLSTSNWYDVYNYQTKRGIRLNGAEVGTPNTTTATTAFTTVNDFYLGGYNGFNLTPFKGKIRYFKSVSPALDLIPVLDSQLRPCFYDKISKTFIYHTNSTGTTTPAYKRWNKFDVDYIESSGTQYINTGYAFTDDFAYEIEYKGLNNGECLLGGRTSSVRTAILYRAMATQSDGQLTVPIAGLNATQTPFKLGNLSDSKHKIKVSIANNKGNVWVDDTQVYTNQSFTGTYISDKTTAIFADHFGDLTGTSEYQEFATSQLYALKFWQGTTLVRDFKPTVWHNGNTSAVACLYDEVYNKMYTNAGTGSFKAYILSETTSYTLNDGVQNDDYYLAENGTKTVSADHTSCYSNAFAVKQGDIIEWTVTAEQVSANKRIHGYTTNADIEAGTAGSWVSMLAKIVFSSTSDTTQTARFTVPSGINYIRVSHANVRESECKITITTTYEVGSNCFCSPATASQQVTNNYFNSGLYGNENWNVKLIAFTSTNVAGQLFGNFISSSANNNLTINSGTDTGTGTISRFNGQQMAQNKIINMGANAKSLLQMNKIGAWQDSTQVVAWNNPNSFTTTGTCYIGGTNGSATVRPNGCCYLLIEENQTPIAEYIPVKNATVTTEYGLYDRVSGTLNTGVGSITFNALS